MARRISFGLAISEETLGESAPVLFQGGIAPAMEKAAAMGFDCAELHVREPRSLDEGAIARAAAGTGIRVAAVGTGLEYGRNGLSLTSEDPAVRAKTAERLREHIDFASRFGAVVFLGLIRGKCGSLARLPACLDLLAEGLVPIAEYAARRGVPLGFEPVAYYFSDLLNSTEETLEFLARPGLGSIGLLLDTHHMFLEDRDMAGSFRRCAGRTTHVHISDSNRRYPGAGNVDFGLVARALDEAGYEGAVSLEVLPAPSGEEAARRGIDWMKRAFGR